MYTIVFRTHRISFSRVFLTYLMNYNFSVELFNNMEEAWGLPLFPFPSKPSLIFLEDIIPNVILTSFNYIHSCSCIKPISSFVY